MFSDANPIVVVVVVVVVLVVVVAAADAAIVVVIIIIIYRQKGTVSQNYHFLLFYSFTRIIGKFVHLIHHWLNLFLG